jgi:carboxypeptidase C (cathepsin A)
MEAEITPKQPESKPLLEQPKDRVVETKHTIVLDGRELRYTVTTGTMILKEETEKKGDQEGAAEGEKPKAAVFYTAYTLDDASDKSKRPLTFAFNGGPGSASVWLHLGMLGPRRVMMDDDGNSLPPPYRLVDNPYSLLDVTDLVFIDPVSTGYSRPVPGERAREFHGFKKDIESVGDFIRLYTTRAQRWTSPKFLAGESYGTTRAAGLSGYLQERHGMYLNGLILISAVLDFMTLRFDAGNELPYILFLPTYTATAWYHGKLGPDLPDLAAAVKEASDFATGDYTLALMKGSALPADERARIVAGLARLTGLSPEYIERTDLRIKDARFTKELLRDQGFTVGRIDSRFKGIDRDSAGENYEDDPSMANIMGPYTAAFYDYVRGELNYESDLPYEVLNYRVWPWHYDDHENRYLNVAETLRRAIATNPHLKVYVANGYLDLATPVLATEYTFNHLGLNETLRRNIRMSYFPAGHMMYVHIPSLAKLREDLVQFIAEAMG